MILGLFKAFSFVPSGSKALLLRFDKVVERDGVPVVVGPGFRWMWPFVNKWRMMHAGDHTINLPLQKIGLTDWRDSYEISGVVICRVKDTPEDLMKALTTTPDVLRSLIEYAPSVLQQVVSLRTRNDLIVSLSDITEDLRKVLQIQADEWGMKIVSVTFVNCSPTQEMTIARTVAEGLDKIGPTWQMLTKHHEEPAASVTPLHGTNGYALHTKGNGSHR
jgi:regulator of protease activity HflC (stomatin/prohibitin superfamily)